MVSLAASVGTEPVALSLLTSRSGWWAPNACELTGLLRVWGLERVGQTVFFFSLWLRVLATFLSSFEEDLPSELGPLIVSPVLCTIHPLESLISFLDYINDWLLRALAKRSPPPSPQSLISALRFSKDPNLGIRAVEWSYWKAVVEGWRWVRGKLWFHLYWPYYRKPSTFFFASVECGKITLSIKYLATYIKDYF